MDTTPLSPDAGPPPPPLAPPPVITPPPPIKLRKGRGWMIFAIALLVLLGFSWLIIFSQVFTHAITSKASFGHGFKPTSSRQSGPRLDEYVLEDNGSANKIAVITVNGIITSHSTDQAGNSIVDVIKAQLDRAANDRRVKAVILKVDSPGGE